jgi:hypothetical protein
VHTFLNVISGVFAYELFDGGAAELRFGIVAAGFVAWAAYIVVRYGTLLIGREEANPDPAAKEPSEFVSAITGRYLQKSPTNPSA